MKEEIWIFQCSGILVYKCFFFFCGDFIYFVERILIVYQGIRDLQFSSLFLAIYTL